MPIYGYGVISAPWTLCKEMPVKRLVKFINIFRKSAAEFKLDEVFLHSIKYNVKMNECYVAQYDISKTNIELYKYQENIEKMITKSNEFLSKNKAFDNYKFDIMGQWSAGKIIILMKK